MSFHIVRIDEFKNLKDPLMVDYLKKLSRHIESIWHQETDRIQNLVILKDFLAIYQNDIKNTLIPGIPHFIKMIHKDMTCQQFLSVSIPIERSFGKETSESEFLVDCRDLDSKTHIKDLFPLSVICDSLRSSFNIGSIVRTSECVGIQSLYLTGYSPTPLNEKVKKSSMGTHNNIEWSYARDPISTLELLKSKNYTIAALETASPSSSLMEYSFEFPMAIVLGNEKFGLSSEVLASCQQVIRIPVFGTKNSLNVANAFSIFSYEARRQWQDQLKKIK